MENVDKRSKTCMFTGHRQIPYAQLAYVRARLTAEIDRLCESGMRYFVYGGALGFDMLAAECVLSLKEKHPCIHLMLVSPCEDQCAKWQEQDIQRYERLKAQCTGYVVLSPHYYNGCMQKRNRFMVEHSSVCIAYLRRDFGGTAYTADYAKSQGLSVITI